MSEEPDPDGGRAPDQLATRAAELLGLSDVEVTAVLTAGQSGSWVVGVSIAGVPAVLKVTSDHRRLDRARRELELFTRSEPQLSAFLPSLLGAHDSGDAVFLVTERLSGPRPVGSWEASDWCSLAERLGRLHAVTASVMLDVPVAARPDPADLGSRRAFWTERCGAHVARTAERSLAAAPPPPDLVLQHGDCHVDNVVLDRVGDFRWIDWQDLGRGDGFTDLVFFWQRSEFVGATPPRPAMLRSYLAGRDLPDSEGVRRRLAIAELELIFLAWPEFLSRGDHRARLQLIARLEGLVVELC